MRALSRCIQKLAAEFHQSYYRKKYCESSQLQMTETNLNDLIKKEIKCLSVIIDSAQMDPETQMISLEISITQFCLPLCWLHTQAGYPEVVAKMAT